MNQIALCHRRVTTLKWKQEMEAGLERNATAQEVHSSNPTWPKQIKLKKI